MKKRFLLLLAFLSTTVPTFAGGFQLNLQGLRQFCMGGIGVAVPWDASSIFYNPGSFARLKGLHVYASGYMVSPKVRYLQTPTGGYLYDNQTDANFPFSFYAGGTVDTKNKLAVGLGVYTPFGNSLVWDDNWTGRYLVQNISLQSIFFQPTVSYQINDIVSVGAGFVYAWGKFGLKRALPIQNKQGEDGEANLNGNANGFGFNLGISIKPNNQFDIGLSYRSGVNMKVNSGQADFTIVKPLQNDFPDTKFTTHLSLPGILTAGIGYHPIKGLTIELDAVYAFWSTYDSLSFTFKKNTDLLKNSSNPRDYKNTLAIRLGAHYQINNHWEVMAGGAYDPTPTQDDLVSPDAVDANRTSVSMGVSYKPTQKLSIMAGMEYLFTGVRNTSYAPANFKGAYQMKALTPALGVSYDF